MAAKRGRGMTASEKFIQLSAEAASRENQSTLLLLLCGGAALLASLMVSEETKAQYGQGLTWETHKIWWWRFLFIYFVPGVLLAELIVQVVTPTVLYEWLVVKTIHTVRCFETTNLIGPLSTGRGTVRDMLAQFTNVSWQSDRIALRTNTSVVALPTSCFCRVRHLR